MLLELHILQNFAPSNLNRDDTGSPKDCDFGGYRRARISSQAIKRAMRREFDGRDLIPAENRATRTKRLRDTVAERLENPERSQEETRKVVQLAMLGLGFDVDDTTGKSQYLLYLGKAEMDSFAAICDENWDVLVKTANASTSRRSKSDAEKLFKGELKAEGTRLTALLDGGRAADLALFGRMLADKPEKNIDAASQVAHAISTHQVSVEFDYYTAVDDLKPGETAGADMIGTVEFNSACYYRYANIDVAQLQKNLTDPELVAQTLRAFLHASVRAIPTGKQNSFAAHNLPSLAFAVVRDGGRCSLANAFVEPAKQGRDADLVEASIAKLTDYWNELTGIYGDDGVVHKSLVTTASNERLGELRDARAATFAELIEGVVSAATAAPDVLEA